MSILPMGTDGQDFIKGNDFFGKVLTGVGNVVSRGLEASAELAPVFLKEQLKNINKDSRAALTFNDPQAVRTTASSNLPSIDQNKTSDKSVIKFGDFSFPVSTVMLITGLVVGLVVIRKI